MTDTTAIEVVDLAIKAATAYDRDDLLDRLRQAKDRLADPGARVLVVGEFKQGKSMLINAVVNAPVCPVDDDVATAVPTEVRYAENPTLTLIERAEPDSPEPRSRTVPIDHIGQYVAEGGESQRLVERAEVGLPRSVLAGGLCLVDTPGVGGLDSAHGARTLSALPTADAVLFVSDAAAEYTESELAFLRRAREICPTVTCVLTKIDLYPEWRRIAELNVARLSAAGISAWLLPVSSTLRTTAVAGEDHQLNAESGFPALIAYLRDDVLANAGRLADRSSAHDVLAVTRQLTASMSAELAALRDPDNSAALLAELAAATERVENLRRRSARWQQTLSDGIGDLTADIDHDLRERMRTILREAEEELDAGDPAGIITEFGEWLHRRVATAASANFVWAHQRVNWLAGQVARHFGADGATELPRMHQADTTPALAQVAEFAVPEPESFGFSQKWVTGMRGGYGGTLMVGMMSTLAGFALVNPVSIAAGVMLGRKTVRDERKRLLARRQAETKAAARRYVDDVLFQMGKQSRDLLREAQRLLRDHFTAVAEQLSRSLTEATQAAQRALTLDTADRDRRVQDLEAELARVANLADLATSLAETAGTPAVAAAR